MSEPKSRKGGGIHAPDHIPVGYSVLSLLYTMVRCPDCEDYWFSQSQSGLHTRASLQQTPRNLA